MMFRLLCVLGFLGFSILSRGAISVPGFAETTFPIPGVSEITDLEWAPDASRRLFITQKGGGVRIMRQSGELLSQPFAVISPTFVNSECGLVGICFDPDFLQNRYIYFFVTVSDSEQQIIRYEDAGNIGINKTVLIGNLPTIGANHDGGGIAVGLDGKLYFSIGDLGPGRGVNADLTLLASKIARYNLDGTVPGLNPFVDGPGGNHDGIWARGFRNPFKLAVQPSTGLIWVNVAGGAYEQVFAVDKGDHGGWNNYENNQPAGYITPRIKYRTNTTDTRQLTPGGAVRVNNVATFTTSVQHGFRLGEKIALSFVADSSFNGSFYVTAVPSPTTFSVNQPAADATSGGGSATTLPIGGAITGGCFYNSTAFPEGYRQNYFFCDFNSGRISRATIGTNNQVTSVDYFITGIDGATDVTTGPNGHLYYANFYEELIYRLVYTNNPEKTVVSPNYLNMAEGGRAVVNLRLTTEPDADVTVTISPPPGNPAFSTTNVALTFTRANYFDTQPVYIEVLGDADPFHSEAAFTVSADGLPTRLIHVNAYDPDAGAPKFTGMARANNATTLELAAERRTRIVLEASTNLNAWVPVSTNVATTDSATLVETNNSTRRFYRARLTP